jgi:CRISPR-associated exonuclease Cas4
MQEGTLEHLETIRLEHRRKLRTYRLDEGKRYFHVFLASDRLGLQGLLDMYLATPDSCFPVEFKNTGHRMATNHKYQLTAYVLLLEEYYGKPVRGGFLYFIPRKEACFIEVTPGMRLFVKDRIKKIRTIIDCQTFPEAPRQRGRCVDCEYKNFCGDVR